MSRNETTPSRPTGRLELICGCMFSGKSERLLERIRQARADGIATAVFKHASDDRYDAADIVTHSAWTEPAKRVSSAGVIPKQAGNAGFVAIDEAQFFDAALAMVCRRLVDEGRKVVVAGLDRNCWGEPFGPVPEIERMADTVTHLVARCACCGAPATYTQRIAPLPANARMVGGPESYEPRCRRCFQPPPSSHPR